VLAQQSMAGAPNSIQWKGADIGLTGSMERTDTEWIFVAASVTWQSLFIIDGLLSRRLSELDRPSPTPNAQRTDDADQLQRLRVFCKRVVDGSRAIKWTIWRDELQLLEDIHAAWSTSQAWRESIDDKTSLLVLIHEQQEAQARETTGMRVGYVALLIAIVSTVSAVADFFTFVDPEGKCLAPGWGRVLVSLLPAIVIGIITASLLGLHRRRSHPRS